MKTQRILPKSKEAYQSQLQSLRLQKELIELESKAKNEFIANIMHDIRSPLAGITQLACHLAESSEDQKTKDSARSIYESSQQILELLNSVINGSESFRQDNRVTKESFHLGELIAELQALEGVSVLAQHLVLAIEVDERIPNKLIGDKQKLKRILLNLVTNAVKFTPAGQIKIKIKQLSRRHNQLRLEFLVSDTGVGIPADMHDSVFKRYVKGSASKNTNYSSNGLGLDIVQKYVQLLGGEISFQSNIGEGAIFSVILSMEIDSSLGDNEIEVIPVAEEEINTELAKELKLLLIEDNPILLTGMQLVMNGLGIQLSTAQNSETAIKALEKQTFDVILTDIELPDGSGYDLSKKIRAQEKSQGQLPVKLIGVTGHPIHEIAVCCKEAGMDDVYQKPLTHKVLKGLIAKAIRDKTAMQPKKE